jgi:hypothetical protein
VLLAGLDAKHWFETFWGKVRVQGQTVLINGRKVSSSALLASFAIPLTSI